MSPTHQTNKLNADKLAGQTSRCLLTDLKSPLVACVYFNSIAASFIHSVKCKSETLWQVRFRNRSWRSWNVQKKERYVLQLPMNRRVGWIHWTHQIEQANENASLLLNLWNTHFLVESLDFWDNFLENKTLLTFSACLNFFSVGQASLF